MMKDEGDTSGSKTGFPPEGNPHGLYLSPYLLLGVAVFLIATFLLAGRTSVPVWAATEEIVSITETTDKNVNHNPNNTNYIIEVNGQGPAGPNTTVHSTTSTAANDASKLYPTSPIINPIYGMNNLSLGIFTSAGYALSKDINGNYIIESGTKDFYGNTLTDSFGWLVDPNSQYQYNYATAFGERTAAANTLATAFGRYSIAAGKASTAFGYHSLASGDYSLAFGGDGSNYKSANTAGGPYSVAFGNGTKAAGKGSVAFGKRSAASGESSVAFGDSSVANNYAATAFGYDTKASGYAATAFGESTTASGYVATALGGSTTASSYAATALGYGTTASNEQATALGDSTTASGINSIAAGYKGTASNYQAVALGNGTTASGVNSIAAGYQTTASNYHAVALGYQSAASGTVSIAAGVQTKASGGSSIAAGYLSKASGYAATALGNNTTASGDQAVALGSDTIAGGINSVAAGYLSKAGGYAATALGEATASGDYSVATGYLSKASGAAATALGWGTTASGDSSVAAGYMSVASGKITTALGDHSEANGVNSLAALGGVTAADADNSAAIGKGAQTKLTGTVALGDSSVADTASGRVGYLKTATDTGAAWVSTKNALSVGDAANSVTRQITGVAAGTEETDAVNVAQLKSVVNSLGSLTVDYVSSDKSVTTTPAAASGQNSAAVGYGSSATSTDAVAVGNEATASGEGSTAVGTSSYANKVLASSFGQYAKADGYAATALGSSAQATADYADALGSGAIADAQYAVAAGWNATAHGYGSIAMGNQAQATESYAVAVGNNATATGDSSTATGTHSSASGFLSNAYGAWSAASGLLSTANGNASQATGDFSSVLGGGAVASEDKSTALGFGATAQNANSVALGANSTTALANTGPEATALTKKDGTKTANYAGLASDTNGTVSVGKAGAERQIQNVAAGRVAQDSTDAINGSQLYAATQALSDDIKSLSDTGLTVAGDTGTGTQKLGKTLTIKGSTAAAGTTYSSDNLTTSSVTDADGNSTVTVKMSTTPAFTSVTAGTGANQVITGSDGVKVGGNTYITGSGLNANSQKVTNVANGTADSDAVNLSQLKASAAGSTTKLENGKNTTVSYTTATDGSKTYKVDLNDDITMGTGTNAVAISGTNGTIKTGTVTIAGGSTNTVTGLSNKTWDGTTITSGRSATEDQLKLAQAAAVAAAGKADTHVKAGTYTPTNGTVAMDIVNNEGTATGEQVKITDIASKTQQDTNTTNIAKNTTNITNLTNKVDSGWTAQVNGTDVKTVTPTSSKLNFTAGDNIVLANDGGSIKITSTGGTDSAAVHYDKDTSGNVDKTNLTLGDGSKPTTIKNVAAGTIAKGSTEAVNGGQLYDTNQRIDNAYTQIGALGSEIEKVGAKAAALSGLHPLDYDPSYKWDFTAAFGGYRSEQAAALGVFYHADENTLFNAAVTVGNSENLYRFGVSMRLGPDSKHHSITSREALIKQVKNLTEENKNLNGRVDELSRQNQELGEKMETMMKLIEEQQKMKKH